MKKGIKLDKKDIRNEKKKNSKFEISKETSLVILKESTGGNTSQREISKIKFIKNKSHKVFQIDTKDEIRLPEKDHLVNSCKTEENNLVYNPIEVKKKELLESVKGRITMLGFTIFQPTLPQDLELIINEKDQLNSPPLSARQSSQDSKITKISHIRSKSTTFKGKKVSRNYLCKLKLKIYIYL